LAADEYRLATSARRYVLAIMITVDELSGKVLESFI
jgi:hypothetical protein